ncbi:peptide-N-glycosidase F-related protein [Flavobacterium soli]|uniref:peptide-N-glycosidase F-related protein n=1 Tax=Flavobacterium soli TaxID=344881 RepID=UPI00040F3CA8|nr:peptide-N-glycosidase F-related protein [Flavobacterium soli]
MKITSTRFFTFIAAFMVLLSCSKDEDEAGISSVVLSATATTVQVGDMTTFTLLANTNEDVTSTATFFVDDVEIPSNTFSPTEAGEYTVVAKYLSGDETIVSNTLIITATAIPITGITLNATPEIIEIGESFTLSVVASNQAQLTTGVTYFVNDTPLDSNVFTPTATGTYTAKATFDNDGQLLTSPEVTLTVTAVMTEVTIFNEVVFYDGYAATVNEPVQPGMIRKSNASYVTKLTPTHIASLSNKLKLQVTIGALCDNYDRIGGVFVNMVNKGEAFSEDNVAKRLEVGRFITPFMNKNISPTQVDYLFETDNLALLFNDPAINDMYDFWIELNVFGVPYAANEQVAGCSGRNDVFEGTLKFISTDETYEHTNQLVVPIVTYKELKNYDTSGTDILGETVRTYTFNVPSSITNAKLYVITSNHGANAGGEEYNRREHFIYFDGSLTDMYVPGGKSCEPFRMYNTQPNGIYGPNPRSLAQWQSFSNWCPGDIIPIRVYELDNVNQGSHTFKIEVPDAEFVDDQGYIPVSVYIQGDL